MANIAIIRLTLSALPLAPSCELSTWGKGNFKGCVTVHTVFVRFANMHHLKWSEMARRMHAIRFTQVRDVSANEWLCNAFSHFNRFALHADRMFAIFACQFHALCLLCFGISVCYPQEVAVGAHVLMISYVQHALMMRVTDSTMVELPLLILIHFI